MTASELADKLGMVRIGLTLEAATMLRQQAEEIEALKKKLENLPMSLKDDIEYWSKK
jgi:hypothetical protein